MATSLAVARGQDRYIIHQHERIESRDPYPESESSPRFPLRPHSMALAEDVQLRADAIRENWSDKEHRRRLRCRPKAPGVAANVTYVRQLMANRLIVAPQQPPRPKKKRASFPPPDNTTPQADIQLPRKPRERPAPPRRPENAALVGQYLRAQLAAIYAAM